MWLQVLPGVNSASAHFRRLMWWQTQLMLVRWGCDGSKPHRSEESEGEQSDLDDGMKVHIPLNPTWSGSDTGNVNRKTHTG